jgi:hypothetical protein
MARIAGLVFLAAILGFLLGWWARPAEEVRVASPPAPTPDFRAVLREELARLATEMRQVRRGEQVEAARRPAEPAAAGAPQDPRPKPARRPEPDVFDFQEIVPKPGAGWHLPDELFLMTEDQALARFGRPDSTMTSGSNTINWTYSFPTGEMEEEGWEVLEVYHLCFTDGRLYRIEGPKRGSRKVGR